MISTTGGEKRRKMRENIAKRMITIGMYILPLVICLALACAGVASDATKNVTDDTHNSDITTADDAWAKLKEGNLRFVAGIREERDYPGRRVNLTAGQHPFATIITCSDSRVPPELLFDQGLGDVFVIRDAGNLVDGFELGSIEYGVEHCHTPLLVVLGHSSCGAVTAAVQGGAEGNIGCIMEEIEPALETAKGTGKNGTELIEETVNENIKLVIKNILNRSSVTKGLVDDGKLTIVGAKYFLDTGEVELLEGIPSLPESPTLGELTPSSIGDAYVRPEINTSSEAWTELMNGNERFVAGELADRDFPSRRANLTAGQHPFATIIGCSDSRVPPELVFDQGLGDVFIIRDAGNVVNSIELGSIEYGVEHCHTPLLVVLRNKFTPVTLLIF